MKEEYVLVLVTTASKSEAEKITLNLVEANLIACGNIVGPVTSIFRWADKTERVEEFLIIMKTRQDLFAETEEHVKALHSYQVPEILAIPVVEGAKPYLNWLEKNVTPRKVIEKRKNGRL